MTTIQGVPDLGPGLRLHLNENTGGCSQKVVDAVRAFDGPALATYPDFTKAVIETAAFLGVDPDRIVLTNGLDEGILMAAVGHIARARIHDAETIVPLPAFDPYPNSTAAVGACRSRSFSISPARKITSRGSPANWAT